MIGNGPYKLESRPHRPRDRAGAEPRVGRRYNEATPARAALLDTDHVPVSPTPTPRTTRSRPVRATPPTSRRAASTEARNYANTLDVAILGSYHFEINHEDDPVLGGEENKLLRQAISQAIDRDEINEAVYDGMPHELHRRHARGHPRLEADLCDDCAYDPEAAQAAFDEWKAPATSSLEPPLRIQFNAGPATSRRRDHDRQPRRHRHRGRPSRSTPRPTSPSWPTAPARSAGPVGSPTTRRTTTSCTTCSTPTRSGGNNYGVLEPRVRRAGRRGQGQTVDPDEQAELFQEAETILLERGHRGHPDQLVPGRLRLQRRRGRRLHPDQLRPRSPGRTVGSRG